MQCCLKTIGCSCFPGNQTFCMVIHYRQFLTGHNNCVTYAKLRQFQFNIGTRNCLYIRAVDFLILVGSCCARLLVILFSLSVSFYHSFQLHVIFLSVLIHVCTYQFTDTEFRNTHHCPTRSRLYLGIFFKVSMPLSGGLPLSIP